MGNLKKILADGQEANTLVPVVVGIVPVDVQVALAVILVEVKIPELAVNARHIIYSTAL